MKINFYEIEQFASNGQYEVNNKVCRVVIIQAESKEQARDIFMPMIKDSCMCPNCSNRWNPLYIKQIPLNIWKTVGYPAVIEYPYPENRAVEDYWHEVFDSFPSLSAPRWEGGTMSGMARFVGLIYFNDIEQYAKFIAGGYGKTSPDVRIYYLSGEIIEVY